MPKPILQKPALTEADCKFNLDGTLKRSGKRIVEAHQSNFETLIAAAKAGALHLMECKLKSTGELLAVACAVSRDSDGVVAMVPMAAFFNGNPFQMLCPPDPDSDTGFFEGDCSAEN